MMVNASGRFTRLGRSSIWKGRGQALADWKIQSGGKYITIVGPGYGQQIEVYNDDVLEDQLPLAEKIVKLLNG